MAQQIDLKKCLNAISDVVNNRPRPIREFDQIFMKSGDMLLQADYISKRFDNKKVVFIGDGDAISLSVMHLKHGCNLFEKGPKEILVLDFDERVVESVMKFAKDTKISAKISAKLYNVADTFPSELLGKFDAFYTNPPFGKSTKGTSVKAFMMRGMQALKKSGEGCVVLADDVEHSWSSQALYEVQKFTVESSHCIAAMVSSMHEYHLDDAPKLKSCNLIVRKLGDGLGKNFKNQPLDNSWKKDFYGKNQDLKVKKVEINRSKQQSEYNLVKY